MKLKTTICALLAMSCDSVQPKKTQVVYENNPAERDASPVLSDDLVLEFVNPKADVTSPGMIDIEINFKSVPSNATWSLYYTTSPEQLAGSTAIVSDLSPTENKVTWDTSFADEGSYYLLVVLKTHDATTIHQSPGRITVEGTEDNRSPFVSLTAPNGAEPIRTDTNNVWFSQGTTRRVITVTFGGSDPDGDALTYKIEYTADDGQSWVLIQDDLPDGTTTYDWNIPDGQQTGSRYRIRVTALDARGKSGYAQSKLFFGIAPQPITYTADLQTLLNRNFGSAGNQGGCAPCHTTNAASSGNFSVAFFTDALQAPVEGVGPKISDITQRTRLDGPIATRMPPNGVMNEVLRDLIQLWRWGGGLEN